MFNSNQSPIIEWSSELHVTEIPSFEIPVQKSLVAIPCGSIFQEKFDSVGILLLTYIFSGKYDQSNSSA